MSFSDNGLGELNTFFHFDPYKLPKSKSYIEGVYREWSSVAIDEEEEEEEEDGEDNYGREEEEEEDVIGQAMPGMGKLAAGTRDADELGASFGGMSISPAPLAGIAGMVR